MAQYFVLDMGGTFVKYALMNEKAEILEQGKFPAVTDDLDHLLNSIEKLSGDFKGRFEGVAVSMPGRINTEQGIAHTGGAFQFFKDTPFGLMLEERLGVPVTLGNDGKCAAMAEVEDGALKGVNSGAVIVLGTGIGGGVVLNRKVWMGASGGAGEFSLLLKDFRKFTKEQMTMDNAANMIWAGDVSTTALMRIFAERKGDDPAKYNGITFFEAYDAGDSDAKESLQQMGRNTAAGIFAIQSILDLECYAIGGGISAREEVSDTIRKCVEEMFSGGTLLPFSMPRIVQCRYGNDANLIGALRFHLDRKI